jgi:hypothetical protein
MSITPEDVQGMQFPLRDEHGFRGPVEAAFHGVCVQGGFTTPAREAARMLLDGGTGEQRALAWIAGRGLTLEDLEWDSGQLSRYRARQEQEAGQ